VKIPATEYTFSHSLDVGYLTPKAWGLAPAVYCPGGSPSALISLIKKPRNNLPRDPSSPPWLLGTTCWALKCKSVLVRIADELRSFVALPVGHANKRQTFQPNAIAEVGSNREGGAGEGDRAGLSGDNSSRVRVCVCVLGDYLRNYKVGWTRV